MDRWNLGVIYKKTAGVSAKEMGDRDFWLVRIRLGWSDTCN